MSDPRLPLVSDPGPTSGTPQAGGGSSLPLLARQLKPNNPGDFELPLRLTLYDNEGKEALKENDILNVHVHVPRTFGYTVSLVWTAIGNFFASLQGIIASMAAVFGAMAGFRALLVRKSKMAAPSAATAAGDAGYL